MAGGLVGGMLGGMLFLHERLTGREWLGCSLIFAAVLLPLSVRRLQERRHSPPYRTAAGEE